MTNIVVIFTLAFLFSASVFGEEWVEGEAIVRFTPEGNRRIGSIASIDSLNQVFEVYEVARLLRKAPSKMDTDYGLDRVHLFRFSPEKEVFDFVQAYRKNRWIELVEPNRRYTLCREPDDSLFSFQWNLSKIFCPEGWEIQTGTDSTVIAVVDVGTDWQHPDLQDNVWINKDEDINLNGQFEPWLAASGGDLDSIDNDLNGYVDDVIGWDWADDDNDPVPTLPEETHGTWCNGIANAVTDNEQGMAGVAYNCRSMAVRCSMVTSTLIPAINYASANGAHVISCSWGSYYPSAVLNDAIQAAHASGVVICAAAGNKDTDQLHYPSCYENVIAVAASDSLDRLDRIGSHSNYGDCIDVCAPGYRIYGTTPGDGYERADGTSASSPGVAGLAALLKARYPDSSNTFIEKRIFRCCDSMPDTLFLQGKLGHGRINVHRALILGDYCWLDLVDFGIDDSTSGNGNGRAEAAETVFVSITLRNLGPWADASSVQAKLSTSVGEVMIIDSVVNFGDIPSDSTRDNSSNPFSFVVVSAEPSWITFYLEWEAMPQSHTEGDSFQLLFDFPKILLVDDDNGKAFETEYEEALDSLGYTFEFWSIQDDGGPGDKLLKHSILIWFTGDDLLTTLTPEEQEDLIAFLDSGGKLFITGQNIGQNAGGTGFYSDYLHSEYLNPRTSAVYVNGVAGDEIGDGLSIAMAALNQSSRDVIRPLSSADSILMYKPDSCAAVKYQSTYRMVYFAFGFEEIRDDSLFADKANVMKRVLDWLDPSIQVQEDDFCKPPERFFLGNSPNPFSGTTRIVYCLPEAVVLKIYDSMGRKVKTIPFKEDRRGFALWNGTDDYGRRLAPGSYFCRFSSGDQKRSRKIVIIE